MFGWFSRALDVGSLGLWDVLHRRGLRAAANRDPRLLTQAVERCTQCRSRAACGTESCPNVMYLTHLEAMERHAPKRDLL